jgi:CheY-like chemotaxis protein
MISQADIHHARILIVDDQPVNVELLEYLLTSTGYKAVSATTDPRVVAGWHAAHLRPDHPRPANAGHERLRGDGGAQAAGAGRLAAGAGGHGPARPQDARLRGGARDFISKPFDPVET